MKYIVLGKTELKEELFNTDLTKDYRLIRRYKND